MRAGYGQDSPRRPRFEQERLLRGADCRRVYFDSKDDRSQPNLRLCIDWLAGRAIVARPSDPATLVVCSLDRLASSIDTLTEIIIELAEKGICLEILSEGVRDRDAKIIADVLRLVKDFRHENIADKSQRGVLVAEQRGRQTGRPAKLTEAKLKQALQEMAEGKPVAEVAKRAGVSVPTLYRYRTAYERRSTGRP